MLPGHVAGFYTRDECHIDLGRMAVFARARLIHAEATGVDRETKQVLLKGRPPINYDVLSINVGSAPKVLSMDVYSAEARANLPVVPVKPIDGFGARWDSLLERVQEWDRTMQLVVVGGGAGGIELALSMLFRIQTELEKLGKVRCVLRGESTNSSSADGTDTKPNFNPPPDHRPSEQGDGVDDAP